MGKKPEASSSPGTGISCPTRPQGHLQKPPVLEVSLVTVWQASLVGQGKKLGHIWGITSHSPRKVLLKTEMGIYLCKSIQNLKLLDAFLKSRI